MGLLGVILGFLISLAISSVIIYVAAKLFGETEGFGRAILAAFIGSIIFTLSYQLISINWIAILVSGISWIVVLSLLYRIGWLKALIIALVVWGFSTLVSFLLPTAAGPL